MNAKKLLALLLLSIPNSLVVAQPDRAPLLITADKKGWEYQVKAGINIGGASPLSMPAEIRKIESYNPKFNAVIEASITKWLDGHPRWGISSGIRVEEKGMQTKARVKNYSTEIIHGGSRVAGYWTGLVKTKYNSSFVTLPLLANYRVSNSWKLSAGMYLSYRMGGDFSGEVSDGYLRDETPTGQKIEFTNDSYASYDFTSDLQRFHYGIQIGIGYRMLKHLTLHTDFNWSLTDIFKKEFKTITFQMYPLYAHLGFGYRF